jgi:hypothetical protein
MTAISTPITQDSIFASLISMIDIMPIRLMLDKVGKISCFGRPSTGLAK